MNEHVVNLDNPFNLPEFNEGDDALTVALDKIMRTPEGRALMWGIISKTKVYNEDFSGNSRDIFDKGQRSIGLWIIALLTELDPTVYPRMLLDVAKQEQLEMKRLAKLEDKT